MTVAGRVKALAIAAAAALAGVSAGDAEAAALDGKKLYMTKTCVACHGKDGRKAILVYPNLAGQNAKYLLDQMKDIKSGARLSGKDERGYPRTEGMKDVMHLVSDEEMKAIADWLAGLAPADPKPATDDAARIKEGEALYKKSGCMSCHGPEGKKPLPAHPFVAGQKKAYVVLQMTEMRDGIRTNGKSKTMVNFVKKLNDEQIALIADYLSQVKR